jgi:hypothetical protein
MIPPALANRVDGGIDGRRFRHALCCSTRTMTARPSASLSTTRT